MCGINIMVSGNVLGYSDNRPMPTSYDMVDLYNRRAINTPMYGHNEVLATLERFKQNHSYEFTPLENDELDMSSTLNLPSMPSSQRTNVATRSVPSSTVTSGASEPIDADVASVMALLNDSAMQL